MKEPDSTSESGQTFAAVTLPGPSITRVAFQIVLMLLAVVAVLWTLYRLQTVLLLLVVAMFFAYFVAPLVAFFERNVVWKGRTRSLPRPLAIAGVYVLIFGGLALAIWLLLPVVTAEISALVKEAPDSIGKAQVELHAWQRYERSHLPAEMRTGVNTALDQILKKATDAIQTGLLPWVGGALADLPWLVLVPILALFLLKDAHLFRAATLRIFPRGRLRWRGDDFFQDVNTALAAYVRAQIIACVLIGVTCTIGFAIIGVPYAVVLGIGAGLLEFIPLAGPLTIALIAIVFAAFHSLGQALAVFVFLAVLRIVQDYVLYPRIIGRGIHLHPLAVIVAILCGAELGGLIGVFLSIPALAVLSVAVRHWREHSKEEDATA